MKKITSKILKLGSVRWRELKFIQQDNFKEWIDTGNEKLVNSLLKYQFADPFKVWQDGDIIYCLDGKHRTLDLEHISKMGYDVPDELPATFIDCKNKKEAAELVLVYSSQYAKITKQGLLDFTTEFDIDILNLDEIAIPGLDDFEIGNLFADEDELDIQEPQSLSESFIMVPFSILDTRTGEWLQRKRDWLSLGFNSQETREDVELIAKSGQSSAVYELKNQMREVLKREPSWDEVINKAKEKGLHIFEGASIFDPVLCELMYNWFNIPNGRILDPFAGGSVRGIIAGYLNYDYTGIDLREEQILSNRKQAEKLSVQNINWLIGDSNKVLDTITEEFDFVFSCPPYADLEVYSDKPEDLSNMDYEDFIEVYRSIIQKSASKLKDNSFACFVVGDVRDKNGFYRNFVSDTIQAFRDAGLELYNEMILINSIGSMAIRLRRQFNSGRKCGKIHQNVLVFYKGKPCEIKEKYGELNLENVLQELLSQPNIAS